MASMKMRNIGILGTSANPLHEGHIAMAEGALQAIPSLHEVSLMVTPRNPLKDPGGYAPVEHRLHLAYLTAKESPRFGDSLKVSEFEVLMKRFGPDNETATLLRNYTEIYESHQPVWMMGADNLAELHTWGHWTEIMEQYPVVVFGRSSALSKALGSVAALRYEDAKREPDEFTCEPGTWCFLDSVVHPASSTEIRARILAGEYPPFVPKSAVEYIREHQLFGYTQKSEAA
jgi:nicotinate-nucleotide adenylyltransferase